MKKVEDTIWKQIKCKLPQYHITFTLASIMLCSQAVVVIGLTCDPKVTNASTRERIRGTFQTSL